MKGITLRAFKNSESSGIALILSLLIVTLLTVSILEFNYTTRVNIGFAAARYDRLRALYLARSGVNFAMALIAEDDNGYDSLDEDWALKGAQVPVGCGVCRLDISDESSKLNLNWLRNKGSLGEETLGRLKCLLDDLGHGSECADLIADWIDEDPYTRKHGSEQDVKNTSLDTVTELLMIKGLDPSVFRGDEDKPGLKDFVTIWSAGININTAGVEVLQCLSDKITEPVALDIIEYRQKNPFERTTDFLHVPDIDDMLFYQIEQRLIVKSNFFKINSIGRVKDHQRTVEAVISRQTGTVKVKYYRILN